MTETITPRRQRRPIGSAPAAPDPTPAAAPVTMMTAADGELQTFLQTLRDAARMKRYRLIGQLSRCQIMRPDGPKTIDFRKEGPILAMMEGSEQIIVVSEWRGIPPKLDDTDQFCPDCLSQCDVCGGSGNKICEAFKCGGSGVVPLPFAICTESSCLDGKAGVLNPHCPRCHGTGSYLPMGTCQVCHGSGKMTCSVCRGTGKRPTGIKDGDTNWRLPACATCKGTKFAHNEIPQETEQFVNARLGDMIALGPIVRFAVDSVGGTGMPPQVFDVDADANGQYLVLLLERDEPGAASYLIGGVLKSLSQG